MGPMDLVILSKDKFLFVKKVDFITVQGFRDYFIIVCVCVLEKYLCVYRYKKRTYIGTRFSDYCKLKLM